MATLRCGCTKCRETWSIDVDGEGAGAIHDPTDPRVRGALESAKQFATSFDRIGEARATHRGCAGDVAVILLTDAGTPYQRRPVTEAGESVLRSEIDARERRKKR